MLQIQPQVHTLENWTALALRQGLSFEALEPSLEPWLSDEAKREALCARLRGQAAVTSLHGAFIDINPGSGDPELRRLSMQRCEESCIAAEQLGASAVVFHCSCFPFLRGGYLERWADLCAQAYRTLADRHELLICVENSMDVDTAPLCALMERAGSARIGVCLDIGHANYSRQSIDRWFSDLRGHIRYLHLSDNRGAFDEHLPLGEGTVDWKRVDALWQSADRPERLTLEVGGLDGVEKSLAFLRKNGLFGLGEES